MVAARGSPRRVAFDRLSWRLRGFARDPHLEPPADRYRRAGAPSRHAPWPSPSPSRRFAPSR